MARLRSEIRGDQHERLNQLSEEERKAIHEELQKVQERCLDIIDAGQILVSKLKDGVQGGCTKMPSAKYKSSLLCICEWHKESHLSIGGM